MFITHRAVASASSWVLRCHLFLMIRKGTASSVLMAWHMWVFLSRFIYRLAVAAVFMALLVPGSHPKLLNDYLLLPNFLPWGDINTIPLPPKS